MSQLQRIEAALREADRRAQQGDQQAVQDAQRLAQAYRAAQQAEQATPAGPAPRVPVMTPQTMEGPPQATPTGMPAQPQQITEGPTPTRRETPRTLGEGARLIGDTAVGTGEAIGTMATGGVAEVLAGLAGIEALLTGAGSEGAAERVRQVQELRTYQPRTDMGRQILEGLGVPFQALGEAADRAGGATLDATGSPGLATGVATAIEASPGLLGIRPGGVAVPGLPPASRQAREGIRGTDQGARDLGVGLNRGVTEQRQQIEGAAERLAAGGREGPMGQPAVPAQGTAIPDVQAGMVAARDQARNAKNALYEQAKQGGASVQLDNAVGLADRLQAVRQDFLTTDMPAANRLLGEVEQLRRIQKQRDALIAKGGQPKDIAVTINQFEEWGQKIQRNKPNPRTDPAQAAAMDRMLAIKDDFMDELFNADMISGNPNAIQAWRRARRANANYRERFSDNKVIRDMVEMEAEPETVRKWIFGANAAGAKTEAADVVRRIKAELGEDSPEFTALRGEAVLDILDPVLGPDPNLKAFIRKYDQFVDRRSGLAQELFGENLKGLTDLRNLAQAHRDRPTVAIAELPGGARILSVAAFGHELAKKSLLVRAGSAAATMLARTTTPSPRRRMMGSILGYDPFAPMFGKGTAAALGASQELANPPSEEVTNRPGLIESMSSGARGRLQQL